MGIEKNNRKLADYVRNRAESARPDRFNVNDDPCRVCGVKTGGYHTAECTVSAEDEVAGTKWMDDLARTLKSENILPDEQIVLDFWRMCVAKAEHAETKVGNQLLRKVGQNKEVPDGFLDEYGKKPIALRWEEVDPDAGRVVIRREHVHLQVMRPHDLRQFAEVELRRAGSEFAARRLACEGARWLAEQILMARAHTISEWAKGDEDGPALEAV